MERRMREAKREKKEGYLVLSLIENLPRLPLAYKRQAKFLAHIQAL
jgi:hypothetical protein